MARSEPAPEQRPLTDEEHEEIKEGLDEFARETRELLAQELGGDPEDYRRDRSGDGRD